MKPIDLKRRHALAQMACLAVGVNMAHESEAFVQWLVRFLFGAAIRRESAKMLGATLGAGLKSAFRPTGRMGVMTLVGHASTIGWGIIGVSELRRMFSAEQAAHIASQEPMLGVQRVADRPVVVEMTGRAELHEPALISTGISLINQDHVREGRSHADTIVVPMYQGVLQPGMAIDLRTAIPSSGIPRGDWIVAPQVNDLNRPGLPPLDGVQFSPELQSISVR